MTAGNGLCACGCGRFTRLATLSRPQQGHIKGQPQRFLKGHHPRARARASSWTYLSRKLAPGQHVHVHRVLAAQVLGKPLPPKAVVHHVDGDIQSSGPRLVICQDQAYHLLLHVRARVVAAGGNPNTERVCYDCGAVKPIEAFTPAAAARMKWRCRGCPAKAARERAQRRKAAA